MNKDPKSKKEKKKKLEELLRQGSFVALFILFAFLIVSYGPEEFSLSRLTGLVSFNGGDPAMGSVYTDDDLNCSWDYDDAINVTIVWLNGSVPYITLEGTVGEFPSPQTISSSVTRKGETWTCNVTLFNTTDNVTDEVSVEVQNSPPINLKIYYGVGEVGSSFTMYEDIQYDLIINATDADNDTLIYSLEDETNLLNICSVASYTGAITCLVDHAILDPEVDGSETTKYQNDTQFQATDNDEGGLPNKLIDFTLIPVNDAPIITLNESVVDINTDTNYTEAFTVTDEEEDAYTLSVVNNNRDSPGSLSYIEINETTKEIYFNTSDGSAAPADFGNYSINITAVDSTNNTVNTTFVYNLTINSTNHAPNITQITQQINGVQGQPFILEFHATDIDVGVGENLSFSSNQSVFTDNFSNFINYTINDVGHYNATINIIALNNTHIVQRDFIVYVEDQFGSTDSTTINAVFNNTNDYPVISDNSSHQNNTFSTSQNISNLNAYLYTNFVYVINGSDVDNFTYEGENITYTMNYSGDYFNLSTDGIFGFHSTNDTLVDNTYLFNITLTDDGTSNFQAGTPLSAFKVLELTVLNNTVPYFVYGLDNINCSEDVACSFNVTGTDDDGGDFVNYSIESVSLINGFGNSSFTFDITQATGIINFIPNQLDVGNYSINLSLQDQRGAVIYDSFIFSINNTNNNPELTKPIVFPNASSEGIFYQIPYSSSVVVTGDDDDLYVIGSTEVLTYSFNITPTIPDIFSINSLTGEVTIDTFVADCANKTYNITITLTDSLGVNDTYDTNFTIYLRSSSPEIESIYPYGNESDNYQIIYAWNNTNQSSGGTTMMVENENVSIIFNHTTVDSDSTLNYNWTVNGELINDSSLIDGNHTLNYTFNFFSSDSYEVLLQVVDDTFNEVNWTWDLNITNVNRLPILNNSLPNFTGNRSVDGSIMVPDYFTLPSFSSGLQRFYDPDFDINEDWLLGDDETSNLTYEYTSGCNAYLNITITGDTLDLKGLTEGYCSMVFTAEDVFGGVVNSNEVFVNVTAKYQGPTEPAGGTTRHPVSLPLEGDNDPFPLEIISAKSVVMYQNQTIIIPIELKNNWTGPLNGVSLGIKTEEGDVEYSLSSTFVDFIYVGESEFVNLTLINYRDPGSYELEIHANVSDPSFMDSALIIINSLEEKNEGETLETKLSFARDLLDNNGECQELVELLRQAEDSLAEGDKDETSKLLDIAINGCKHMIEEYNKQSIKEEPGSVSLVFGRDFLKDLFNNRTILLVLGIIILVIVLGLVFLRKWMLKKKPAEFANIEDEHKSLNDESK